MTTPIWMLLAFAAWTVLLLVSTIGVYRWGLILTRKAPINAFRADQVEGSEWYRRSMRAHANCVENLPVFGAIVFALYASQLSGAAISYLSVAVLIARVAQSFAHICFQQTQTVAALRFAFFFAQIICFVSLIVIIVRHATSTL